MFEDSLVESKISGAKKTATLAISTLVHVALVAILVVLPLLVTDVLPAGGGTGFGGVILAPGARGSARAAAAPSPPGSKAPSHTANAVEIRPVHIETAALEPSTVVNPVIMLPTAVPERIAGLQGAGEPGGMANGIDGGVLGGKDGGIRGGFLDGIVGGTGLGCAAMGCGGGGPGDGGLGIPAAPPPQPTQIARVIPAPPRPVEPPPPPPVNVPEPNKVIRVSEGTQLANCIKCPAPEYPSLARTARITDTVVLSARISRQGNIEGLTIVRGHILLREAAEKAVRQWLYKPTLLNGEAVEVQTTISIQFVFR